MFTIHMSQVICIGLSRVNWGQPLIQLAKSRLVCGRDVVSLPAGRVHKHLKWFIADVANKEVVFEKSSTTQHCKPEQNALAVWFLYYKMIFALLRPLPFLWYHCKSQNWWLYKWKKKTFWPQITLANFDIVVFFIFLLSF